MTSKTQPAVPDWVSAPGETISDLLDEYGWSQKELAGRMGLSTKHVSQLVNGKVPITEDTAVRLERVLGSTARFWLEREAQYREALERQRQLSELADHKRWLSELPLKDMIDYGWVRRYSHQGQQVAECLTFFGVATIEAWRERYAQNAAAFRASSTFEKQAGAVGAWLRQTERQASTIECEPFSKSRFRQALDEARALTSEVDPECFIPQVRELCRQAGVAMVLEPTPQGCPLSGAARWLGPHKALIALSLRHKSNDHLWFSFFHEAAHILCHSKKLQFVDLEGGLPDAYEEEANAFARDILIPPAALEALEKQRPSEAAIREFAARIGVAPGVVVDRLQKDGFLAWSQMNHLKVRYQWNRKAS